MSDTDELSNAAGTGSAVNQDSPCHSLLISTPPVTHSTSTHTHTLTGTLSGYLLRILADSTHRCSEGETEHKQEVRVTL